MYKCIAKIAETFVFVYLGMACVRMAKVGLFAGTTWRLGCVAVAACFLGRLHVFAGSAFINRFRTDEDSDPPPIRLKEMLVMWLSGLRGGVAFAIAAVSWKHEDFPQCEGGAASMETCAKVEDLVANDSTAVLQITMMVAVFTIFVLGGSMTTIAKACDVLDDGSEESTRSITNRAAPLLKEKTVPHLRQKVEKSHSWLVRFLTHEEDYDYIQEDQDDHADRFIGRGSVFPVNPERPLIKAQSSGSILIRRPRSSFSSKCNSSGEGDGYEPPSPTKRRSLPDNL